MYSAWPGAMRWLHVRAIADGGVARYVMRSPALAGRQRPGAGKEQTRLTGGETQMTMQTYDGACHCGACRFRVTVDLDHVRVCDCSLCRKRGALNHRVTPEQIEVLTPLEDLTVYQWHTKTAIDYFCPTCGILPFRRPRTAPELWTVNVRCLEGVDLLSIPTQAVFGGALP